MKILLNILWFLGGGLIAAVTWTIAGLFWCITIIGIPMGIQCFKFAKLSLAPFGKEIKYGEKLSSFIMNIFWLLLTGLPLAIENFFFGCFWCITIVGIPWGLQFFKFAKLAFAPFGAEIVKK